jgi:hypothetical protein
MKCTGGGFWALDAAPAAPMANVASNIERTCFIERDSIREW